MRIRCALLGAVVAALALAMSCATKPPAAEPEAAPPPAAAAPAEPAAEPAAQAVAAPDELKAEAAALRKRAFDLGIKDVLPAEYAAAEEAYSLGNAKYGADNAASEAAYRDAIDRYSGAIERGLPFLASTEADKARAGESAAYRAGLARFFYEIGDATSAALLDAEASEKAGEYEKAIAGYKSTAAAFAALASMCDAAATREAIAARDFAKWDPSNWTLAEGKLSSARELLGSDSAASLTAADEAGLRYELVMQNALGYYMADRKTFSEAERDRASSIKAEVAVRDDYAAAAALYEEAEAKRAAEEAEAATELYERSASAFSAAYETAKGKMDSAMSEIESLDAALETAAR
jgi:golgin subfamily B member 1